MKIVTLEQMHAVLPDIDVAGAIEAAFVAYSRGRAVVPPVGELVFDEPPGDVHIKYGYLRGDEYYVIKIASGFYDNPQRGLSSSNGMMLLFRQATGEPVAMLLDEGHLTNVRTAAAGAVAAKHLAPKRVERIGIMGTGIQARMQLEYLVPVTPCRDVLVWGRSSEALSRYVADVEPLGFEVATTRNDADIAASCNLIVTTTPAAAPILSWSDTLSRGAHITAMGSDTENKQELDATILKRADILVADSVSQCRTRGEIHQALKRGMLDESRVVELGTVIAGETAGRTSDNELTVADLTGVAVQDMAISKAVYDAL